MERNPLLGELPTISETVIAIKLLSTGKAPGSDAIPADIYKAGVPFVTLSFNLNNLGRVPVDEAVNQISKAAWALQFQTRRYESMLQSY